MIIRCLVGMLFLLCSIAQVDNADKPHLYTWYFLKENDEFSSESVRDIECPGKFFKEKPDENKTIYL